MSFSWALRIHCNDRGIDQNLKGGVPHNLYEPGILGGLRGKLR